MDSTCPSRGLSYRFARLDTVAQNQTHTHGSSCTSRSAYQELEFFAFLYGQTYAFLRTFKSNSTNKLSSALSADVAHKQTYHMNSYFCAYCEAGAALP
jgi:hypothetical protein